MPGKGTRVANHTIRLDAPNLRLANLLAMRYGVTLQQLIEALVLGCAERDGVGGPGAATPVATPSNDTRRRGNVIDLSAVRERRRARAQRRANPVSLQTTDRRARAGAVVERSQHARAMAAAACEMAGQARLRAEEV
jgi:hypothetical protein